MKYLMKFVVCGLGEVSQLELEHFPAIVSIQDPGTAPPIEVVKRPAEGRLLLYFHDISGRAPGLTAPSRPQIRRLLQFGERLRLAGRDQAVIFQCHHGISRSAAAAYILLAQESPAALPEALFNQLLAVRPQAAPNLKMVALADSLAGYRGTLLAPVRRHLDLLTSHLSTADSIAD